MMYKRFFILLFMMMMGVTVYASSTTFTDVPSSHWAYQAINQMAEDGVVNGYEDMTFKPDQEITRAEFAKIFSISMGLDANLDRIGYSNYLEVPIGYWAYDYIQSAMDYFPSRENDNFEPEQPMTREDAAYAFVERISPKVSNENFLKQFTDSEQIAPDKANNVSLAVASGIMNGNENGTINPKGNLTRAEVCTLIYNIKYKLHFSSPYLSFGKILKHIEADIYLNGSEKNQVNYEFIFDVPDIKSVHANVVEEFSNINAKVTYGTSSHPEYLGMPTVNVSFSTNYLNNFRIFVDSLETSNGNRTYRLDSILNYDPYLELQYREPISANTTIHLNWANNHTAEGEVKWTLDNGKQSGTITKDDFSIADDIFKNANLKRLGKTIDITISAEDKAFYPNNTIQYNFHINGIKK